MKPLPAPRRRRRGGKSRNGCGGGRIRPYLGWSIPPGRSGRKTGRGAHGRAGRDALWRKSSVSTARGVARLANPRAQLRSCHMAPQGARFARHPPPRGSHKERYGFRRLPPHFPSSATKASFRFGEASHFFLAGTASSAASASLGFAPLPPPGCFSAIRRPLSSLSWHYYGKRLAVASDTELDYGKRAAPGWKRE